MLLKKYVANPWLWRSTRAAIAKLKERFTKRRVPEDKKNTGGGWQRACIQRLVDPVTQYDLLEQLLESSPTCYAAIAIAAKLLVAQIVFKSSRDNQHLLAEIPCGS